jgi:hypothetical protein
VYKAKFNKHVKSLTDVLNVTQDYIEFKTNSNNLNNKKSLSLINYTHKCDNIHNYEWSNFQKIEQLGDFILITAQFTTIEYILRWGEDLQSIPRVRSFISQHKNQFEASKKSKSQLDSVLGRPLLLVLQNDFWKGLMESYFKYVHHTCMLFSLVDFNPKTAPESLLSAIYFAGYIIQPNRSEEVFSYMKAYAICNIKKIQFRVSLSSVQALAIYCFAFLFNGDASLSRVCLSHFGRMSYALGINIHRKNLPDLAQYNRRLVCNFTKSNYNWTKLVPSKYTFVSEEDEDYFDVYDPKYQLLCYDLKIGNSEHKNILYSIFCCQFNKLINLISDVYYKLGKYDSKRIKLEIESLNIKTIEEYKSIKFTFESLMITFPECKKEISLYLELIKAPYIPCILCINSKMVQLSINTNHSVIKTIVNSSIELLEVVSNHSYLLNIWKWGPDIIAFCLLQTYPNCTKKQRKTVLSVLKLIIDLYHKYDFNFNSINYLILKSQFNKL